MKRFGIPAAPNGCGQLGAGACQGCIARAARRGRWAIRQLLPLTYRTHYGTNVSEEHPQGEFENLVVWKMWLGRCYRVERMTAPRSAVLA